MGFVACADNYAAGTQIFVQQTGTTDYAECARRGLCNRFTGTCECFLGYGPSNGAGQDGTIDDCGARVTYTPEFGREEREWERRLRGDYHDWQQRDRARRNDFGWRDGWSRDRYRDRGLFDGEDAWERTRRQRDWDRANLYDWRDQPAANRWQ